MYDNAYKEEQKTVIMIKEGILNALSALGFIPEEIEDFGYRFEYEGLTVLWPIHDCEEAQCVNLLVPDVFDITEENRMAVYEAMVKLSCKMKYVQPQIAGGTEVWLNYQHFIGDGEVTPDILEHMIRVLAASTTSFHKIINGDNNDK